KPTVRSGADVAQGNNSVKPSPSDKNGVTVKRVDEKPSREAVEKALVKANEMAKSLSRKLNFFYDDRIDKVVVKVMEGDTEKVIRQIPPEEMIRLSVKMDDLLGMLINQDV
ncbi:MAG: flagellar protein FlaG, partial [Deltaproteobacteria bacterium]|nr:flagellar protein FlaG [Deltaproteobacteria bacterium]